MSAFAQQQSIAFRANVVAKSVSSKKQSKKIQRCSLRVEAAKKSVGDLSKSDLEGTLNNAHAVAFFVFSSLFLYFCTEKCDGRLVLRLFFSVSVRITRVFFYLNARTFARINHHRLLWGGTYPKWHDDDYPSLRVFSREVFTRRVNNNNTFIVVRSIREMMMINAVQKASRERRKETRDGCVFIGFGSEMRWQMISLRGGKRTTWNNDNNNYFVLTRWCIFFFFWNNNNNR